ncbi:MAG: hypothetical protein NWQ29_00810, partial [Alphaproteobacteria bacterium]|nr:hypothetical protein [Alphaproteobacteria bacterium]
MFIPIGNKNTYCARSAVITRLRGKCGDPAAFLLDGHVFLRLAITKEALIVLIRFSALFLFACQMHVMAAGGIASCDIYIRQQESFYNIPPHLLKAVSLVESGRTI